MPYIHTDCIVSDEDKLFDASLGNWQGDATWSPGPIRGHSGLALLDFDGSMEPKTLKLYYPNFKIFPGCEQSVYWLMVMLPDQNPFQTYCRFTNGIYTLDNTEIFGQGSLLDWVGIPMYPPVGIEKAGSFVELTITPLDDSPLSVYIDAVEMFAEVPEVPPETKKPQYLPIMGVG